MRGLEAQESMSDDEEGESSQNQPVNYVPQ
jgi:hypothetical protein